MSKIQEVTKADFATEVIESSKQIPVIVDFWAPWCGPCLAMAPIYEEAAGEMAGKAKFVKVNVDEEVALQGQYGIMSIPTVIYFKDGLPASQTVGLINKNELYKHIEKLMQ